MSIGCHMASVNLSQSFKGPNKVGILLCLLESRHVLARYGLKPSSTPFHLILGG